MRKIKFRAWDKVNKVMLQTRESWLKTWKDSECDPDNDYDFKKLELFVSQDGHILEDTFEHGVCDMHYYLQGEPKYDLMQYTGLKDSKGQEIYEGDILYKYGDNYNGVIEWADEDEWIEGTGWFIHEYYPKKGKNKEPDRYHTTSAYTSPKIVIGNIFETPELKHKWGD